ncbi:MAG: hypothetical protein R3F61_11020 [Myxococcota bacterium]
MKRTGRLLPGPGASLVEVVSDTDLKHMAVVFDAAYRDHSCLNGDLEVRMGFMEQPEVTGLSRMVAHAPEAGAFLYPTGTVWSVAELVRELAGMGEVGGVKAALELCYLAGEILVEGADKAVHSGLEGHGNLDPWRLMLKADGQITIIGYGLPRPEIEVFLEDDNRLPSEDGLRYCAPETLAEEPTADISSDLFSLALVALELMVGRPVYDGLVADVRQQAARGEAVRRLYQWRDKIPDPVREVIGKALKPDPDIRYRDGLDFVYSVHDVLGGIDAGDGPSLREVVTRVRARQKRGKAVVGGNTGALTRAELAELAADIDEEGVSTRLPEPRRPRPDESEDDDAEKPRWRRASRGNNTVEPEAPAPRSRRGAAPPAASEEASNARERLLRRLRDRDDNGDSGARRRRRPSADAPGELPERPRRRGREREPLERLPRQKPLEAEEEEATEVQDEAEVRKVAVLAKAEEREAKADEIEAAADPSSRRRRGGRAAALLERLRSSSGGHTTAELTGASDPPPAREVGSLPKPAAPPLPPEEPDPPEDDEELETAVIEPEDLPKAVRVSEAAGREAAGARAEVVEDVDAETVDENAEWVDDRETSLDPVALAAGGSEVTDPLEAGDVALAESEATLVAPRPRVERTAPVETPVSTNGTVVVTHGGRTVTVPSGPVGAVREAALDALGFSETDLFGRQTCYFRPVVGGRPVDTSQSAPGRIELVKVENLTRMVVVEVPGSPATRVRTPVGVALPVRSVKRAIRELLGITGAFELSTEGSVLADHSLLADAPGSGELALKVVT